MFQWEIYDKAKDILWEIEDIFLRIINSYETFSREQMAQCQDNFIWYGNLLENNFHCKGTAVISALEDLCEDIWLWYSTEDIAYKLFCEDACKKDIDRVNSELLHSLGDNPKNTLALGTIVRNEARYIEEWLEFHLYHGVSRFYIYDNESTDSLQTVLQPYIKDGIVEYIPWPGETVQLSAYNNAIARFKDEAGYIGFIDADEFLLPMTGKNLPDTVDRIFFLRRHVGAIGVNWRTYGSSGHVLTPDGLVTEEHLWRAEDSQAINRHIKSIVNPRAVEGYFENPHNVIMKQGYVCISENGTPFLGPFFSKGNVRN